MKIIFQSVFVVLFISMSVLSKAQTEASETTQTSKSIAAKPTCNPGVAVCNGTLPNRRVLINLDTYLAGVIRSPNYPFQNSKKIRINFKRLSNNTWGTIVLQPFMLSASNVVTITVPATGNYNFFFSFTLPNTPNCSTAGVDPNSLNCIDCVNKILRNNSKTINVPN